MTIRLYHVDADIDTGQWISEPKSTGLWVEEKPWANEPDSDTYHCDTYEVEVDGITETRAVKVFWIQD